MRDDVKPDPGGEVNSLSDEALAQKLDETVAEIEARRLRPFRDPDPLCRLYHALRLEYRDRLMANVEARYRDPKRSVRSLEWLYHRRAVLTDMFVNEFETDDRLAAGEDVPDFAAGMPSVEIRHFVHLQSIIDDIELIEARNERARPKKPRPYLTDKQAGIVVYGSRHRHD